MDSTFNLLHSNEMKMQKHLSTFNDLVNTINNQSNILEMEANVQNLITLTLGGLLLDTTINGWRCLDTII